MATSKGKVFLTGADGFIGSHLAETLIERGYEVKALVQYNSLGHYGWLDKVRSEILNELEVVSGDVRDSGFITREVTGCNAVLHLAALIAIPYSFIAPRSYVETNIIGTQNILEASLVSGITKIIHTSTSEVFGTAQYVPIDEKHPISAQSPYAASKAAADQLAFSYWTTYKAPVTILRPFNTYGPRQSARAIIPTIISQVLSGINPIALGNLDATRDFTYVSDTAMGFVNALEFSQGQGESINLGTGFEISIRDLVHEISSICGIAVDVELDEARLRPGKSEVERLLSNPGLAQKNIQWDPKYKELDGLKKGLSKTIEWFSKKENLVLYRPGQYNV